MFSPHTVQTARDWYNRGVTWVYKQSTHSGITYLDKALAVFEENGDLRMSALTRHHKLFAFCLDQMPEEVENLFPQVMQEYVLLDEKYGQALLLCHLADSLRNEFQWPRAIGHYHSAVDLATQNKFRMLQAYVTLRQASLFRERDNLSSAIDLLQQTRQLIIDNPHSAIYSNSLLMLAQCLIKLGESSEAVPLLEELQNSLSKQDRLQEALEPLGMLSRLYEQSSMQQDKLRVSEKLHLCGQRVLNTTQKHLADSLGPFIDRSFYPPAN